MSNASAFGLNQKKIWPVIMLQCGTMLQTRPELWSSTEDAFRDMMMDAKDGIGVECKICNVNGAIIPHVHVEERSNS